MTKIFDDALEIVDSSLEELYFSTQSPVMHKSCSLVFMLCIETTIPSPKQPAGTVPDVFSFSKQVLFPLAWYL